MSQAEPTINNQTAMHVTVDSPGYRRPARFYVWRGEVLVAVSNATMPDAELKRLGHLFAASPEMLEVLRAVEWAGQTDAEEGGYVSACPFCDGEESNGHHDHCQLAAAIAKAEGRKGPVA